MNEGGKFGCRMGPMILGAQQGRLNSCRSRHTDTTQQFQGQAWVGPWNTLQKQKLQVLLHHLWPVEIHFLTVLYSVEVLNFFIGMFYKSRPLGFIELYFYLSHIIYLSVIKLSMIILTIVFVLQKCL